MVNDFGEYIVPVYTWNDEQTAIGKGYTELIRCKDCKWYYRGGATCMYWDGENGMRGDDYCSRAERKEE